MMGSKEGKQCAIISTSNEGKPNLAGQIRANAATGKHSNRRKAVEYCEEMLKKLIRKARNILVTHVIS